MLTPVYSGRVPGDYYTVALCKGVRSPANTRPILVAGQIEASGSGTVNVVELCTSPEDGRDKGGSGSGLHLATAGVFRGGPTAIVYAVPVGVDTGTAGTKDIVFGGNCTVAGSLQVQVGREIVDVAVDVGDSGDDVGAAVAALFAVGAGTNQDAPVTSAWVGGTHTLTYTAKDPGTDSQFIRYAFRDIPTGITIAGAGTDIESTLAAGGGDAAYSAAFAAAFTSGMPSYDFVVPCTVDSTALTTATTGLKDRITANASATIMRQMNAAVGCNTVLADATALSAGFDDGGTDYDEPGWRWQVIWGAGNWAQPFELAATEIGIRATKTATDRNYNWSGKTGATMPGIFPPSSVASYPTFAELEAALTSGVTPLKYERNELGFQYGITRVVRPTTCKFSSGAATDLRAADTNIPDTTQAVAMGMHSYASDLYQHSTITDDTDDGVPPADLPENCFTPSMKRAKMIARYKSYYCDRLGWCDKYYRNDLGELTDVANLFVCERDLTDSTATNDRIPVLVRRWHMRAGYAFEEFGSA